MFWIQDAENNPSPVSALMNLLFGIMNILCFDNMRNIYCGSYWSEEGQKTETAILERLGPSVLVFVVAMMSFVWRTSTGESHSPLSPRHMPSNGTRTGLDMGPVDVRG